MFDPLEALKSYLRFPSVSTDSAYREGMDGARAFLSDLLRDSGFEVEEIETPLHPIILAERDGRPEWPHVVIYGHYDVQPVDPLAGWDSDPFHPEVRGERLYGRGAADNKGPFLVHLAAVTNLLARESELPLRITFLIEGEEEIGSPSFEDFLDRYQSRLRSDFVLLSDTGSPNTEQIAITTGLRGVVCLEVIVTGPKKDLHSGVHGGALLNPIQALTELCASLHRSDGTVNLPGFYDDVVPVCDWERGELSRLDVTESQYASFLGINSFHTVGAVSPFESIRFGPTLEFNGIGGGYAGEGTKTVIPSQAFVKISCRIVPDQDPEKIMRLLTGTLRDRCSPKVSLELIDGHCGAPYAVTPPGRENTPEGQSPILSTAFKAAEAAISKEFGRAPLYLREGGSVPIIADLKRTVGLDSLMIGLCTPEDNLHAPNESFHLGVFEKAIRVSEQILLAVATSR